MGSGELVGEGEAWWDSGVLAAEAFEEFGAVALLAAVEEDDVVGEFFFAGLGAVEDGLDGGEGLVVGEVALAAHDSAFEEPGAGAGFLHEGVVVGFEGEDVEIAEAVEEGGGDAT